MPAHDVLIIGAGLAGQRAALAAARERRERRDHEQGPPRALALGGRRRRHQRGDQRRRRLALARLRHRQGLGLPRRPGRDRSDVLGGARRGHAPRAHRRDLPPQRQGRDGPARVRRGLDEAHRLRRRHHRPGDAARALRAADEAPRDGRRATRSGSRPRCCSDDARPLLRRDRARRAQRAHGGLHRQERDPRVRRRRPGLQADHQRPDRHRRRDRDGLPRGRAADGHGDGPVPPHVPGRDRHPDHRGRARRGRAPAQRQRRTLHGEIGAEQDGARLARRRLARRADRDQRGPRRRPRRRRASTSTSPSCRASARSRRCARSSTSARTSPASTSRANRS